jgi:hypothetical protein
MSLQETLNKLELLLIELNFTAADVAQEVNMLEKVPVEDSSFLQHQIHLVDIATHNLITSAHATLRRNLERDADAHRKVIYLRS